MPLQRMESILIPALVAAGVSSIGVLISLTVARRVQAASSDQLRFRAALKEAERSIREIKTFCNEAEKLRDACWQVLTTVCGLQKHRDDNQELLALSEHEDPFGQASSAFFQAFAILQAGIPDSTVHAMRDLRQQCKSEAEEVLRSLNELSATVRRAPRAVSFDHTLYSLRLRLENLLSNLDRLFFTVLMARDTILVDAWVGRRSS
jgi:hypothetical protein